MHHLHMHLVYVWKGALTQNFYIYSINEVVTQTFFIIEWNELFSEEKKVPRTLFEAQRVAGSATYKQKEISVELCLCCFACCHESYESLLI